MKLLIEKKKSLKEKILFRDENEMNKSESSLLNHETEIKRS